MTTAVQPHPIQAECTIEEARALTEQIKGGVERTWGLLITAYERQAWKALDYTSWQSYVTAEFGISRSRSYQLIDQATVVREIQAAADVTTVDVTEAVARDVKPHLEQVTEQIREAVADVPDDQARADVAAQVVQDAREQFVADRRSGEVQSPQDWAADNDMPDPGPASCDTTASTDEDGWSPSTALEPPAPASRPRPATPAKSTRPLTMEQDFAEAVRDLHKAVNRIEGITGDGRFIVFAGKLDTKHRPAISDAAEGLTVILTRLTDVAARTKRSTS